MFVILSEAGFPFFRVKVRSKPVSNKTSQPTLLYVGVFTLPGAYISDKTKTRTLNMPVPAQNLHSSTPSPAHCLQQIVWPLFLDMFHLFIGRSHHELLQ